jgi:probable HAF family extracellular repeat protein
MNDAGQVTGYSYGSGWSYRMAFRYMTGIGLQNLGTLGGSDSEGTAINARGQVAGTAVTGYNPYPHFHAFRYTDGVGMQDLAPQILASNGVGMNNRGEVVGRALFVPDAYSPDHDLYEAFLYTDAGGMVNLNNLIPPSSGWILHTGTGINDDGQIVGVGELNGQPKVFRLTMNDTEPPVITTAAASLSVLWPPDGRMVPVSFTVAATDLVDPQPTCRMASISTNEPDGTEQFVVTGPFSATFAAARDGNGTGRVYTVTLSCSDRTGNTAVRDVIVTVPHNQ